MGASEWRHTVDGWMHRSGWRVMRMANRRVWLAFSPRGGRALGEHRTRADAMAHVDAVWESYAMGTAIRDAAMAGHRLAAVSVEHVGGWPVVEWWGTESASLGDAVARLQDAILECAKEKPGSRPGRKAGA